MFERMEGFYLFLTLHLLFLSSLSFTHGSISPNITDRSTLLSFKSLIYNDPYGVLSSWNDSIHRCKWPGVKCGRRHPGRVTSLVLESFHLSGYISPSLANLTFIRNLNLYDNLFSGNIPDEIGRCSRLRYLNLKKNSLGGEIPNTLSNCSNLQILHLSYNNLQEYGMGVKASIQGDIYSYGILLFEMFTGIGPTDDRFKDGLILDNFVKMSLHDKVIDIIASNLVCINDEENNGDVQESVYDCLVLVIKCGLLCYVAKARDIKKISKQNYELVVFSEKYKN